MANVLVVDDRPVNRDLVRTLLGYYGHSTIEADDGAQALLLARSECPDLVITDVLMPAMDGYELVREIRADATIAAIPVIFYTANYLEEEARPIAEALGVSRVVIKTGDLSALLNAVHEALTEEPAASTPLGGDDFSREHLRVLNAKLVDKIRELEEKERLNELVDAAVAVSENLSLPATMQRIVVAARSLVGARYAALRVTATNGELVEFAEDGQVLTASDPGTPTSSLTIEIRVHGEQRGSLHLVERRRGGDFGAQDEALLLALGAASGSAIANAQLYDDARRRTAWLSASAEITAALLAADPGQALDLVTRGARRVIEASTAWIEVTADVGTVMISACDGLGSDEMLGKIVELADAPLLREMITTGRPILLADPATDGRPHSPMTADGLSVGPLMAIPLTTSGQCLGALVISNGHGGRAFSTADVEMATTFAAHAVLAMEFRRVEADRRRLTVVEDRDRIARDLHDVVIQRLFAVGMQMDGYRTNLPAAELNRLDATIADLNETIDEIRNTIFRLSVSGTDARSLRTQLLGIADQAAGPLGFAARVLTVGPIDSAVPDHIVPEVLATVREALSNTARHAQASSVHVLLSVGAGELELQVTDDGCGLPIARHESGLANLRHRAQALGGTMSASDPGDGQGLTLTWRVPTRPRRDAKPEGVMPDERSTDT